MTSKPNAGGGSKDCVTGKDEEAVHNFVHADKVTTNSSTDQGKQLLEMGFILEDAEDAE